MPTRKNRASVCLAQDESPESQDKPGDLLHLANARILYLLDSNVGTELASEKLKAALRCPIVSVINRTIHSQLRKVTMMSNHTKERSMMEHPSRRSFLGMSSVALATAAFAGLTANAQEKASTQKAEHDHSSSDPGQENKTSSDRKPKLEYSSADGSWRCCAALVFLRSGQEARRRGWMDPRGDCSASFPLPRILPASICGSLPAAIAKCTGTPLTNGLTCSMGNARVTVMNPDGTMFIGDVSEGDLWIFPAGFPHSIQGLGPDGTEFLLVFNQGNFSEDGTMLLSETVAHIPPEVLAKNTCLDKSVFAQTPGAPLYIFPGSLPQLA